MTPILPCLIFEDAHLLVVAKPAGLATHRAGAEASWGMVEWIGSCRPDLVHLGVHQRLDRATSGVLLFAKSPEASRGLAEQFEGRVVRKTYLLVTQGSAVSESFTAREPLEGREAVTHFQWKRNLGGGLKLWEACPETGRTHQVRLHAAHHGLGIIGDGETVGASEPLLLHASRLELKHPVNGQNLVLEAPTPNYLELADTNRRRTGAALRLREALVDSTGTDTCRWIHRESDGFPGLTVDRMGDWAYVEDFVGKAGDGLMEKIIPLLEEAAGREFRGVIVGRAEQGVRRDAKILWKGDSPPEGFHAVENGVKYHLSPMEAGGVGLFLDQRENRRRILGMARGVRVLNLFAYTCGFSVAAAAGGATETVSVDLSKKVLEVGRRNFTLNGMEVGLHRFYAEDAFDMLRRLGSKNERFEIVVMDPPSFSRGKKGGSFSVKKDFGRLVRAAIAVLKPGGWLLASSNHAGWKTVDFLGTVIHAVKESGRVMEETVWVPQGVDFPATAACPAHLKTTWVRLS